MKIKIVSLNLWNGGKLFGAARDFLLAQQADIYFLQEAYNGRGIEAEERFRTVELLEQAFPDHQSFFAPAYLDVREKEGKIDDGNLLLSRWSLLDQKNVFIDHGYAEFSQDNTTDFSTFPAGFQQAEVEWEGQRVRLFNVHGPVNLNGTEDSERRLKLRDMLLAASGPPAIIAGDFNVRPQTQTIKGLEAQFVNVFKDELSTTFNVRRKDLVAFPGYADSVVDMVFASPELQVVKHECPQVDISDHLPLVVELELG